MKGRGNWMERLAEEMEMDELSLPGRPLVEICGDHRVLIENHRGVSRFGVDGICVRVAYGEIAVRGCNLELAKMTREQLLICGRIEGVTLLRRGGR